MQPTYFTMTDLLEMIDEPQRSICMKILGDHRGLFGTVQGSSHNHQAWVGGYLDHITEAMNIGLVLYNQLNLLRPLQFTLSDVLLVIFLHDIEKPWKYELIDGKPEIKPELVDKGNQKQFRDMKLKEYGILLSEEQANAMQYVEGEYKDYSSRERMMHPLAALCHLADITSARIWHDYPKDDDPWIGAMRSKQ